MHLDLTLIAQSAAGTTSTRSYAMSTSDPTTVVVVMAGDFLDASNGVQITQLTAQNPRVQVADSSTFVFYAVTQGNPPQAIWMDAVDGGANVHLDLHTSPQPVAGTLPSRSYAMFTNDPTTVVIIYAADAVFGLGLAQITQLTAQNPRVQVTDSSTYVYYTVTQGNPPSRIWMDAVGGGAPAVSVTSLVTSAFTASPGQLVLVNTQSGPVTVTLPDATNLAGEQVIVKDALNTAGTNNITVATTRGQEIDNQSTATISTNYGSLTFVSDGSNWWIVA